MAHTNDKYYVPHGSHWPIVGSIGLFIMMIGVSGWLNGGSVVPWMSAVGVAVIIGMIVGWFGNVIDESERGIYSTQVDKSFRMGMSWFIFSEVMFFAAFFGALFYTRNMALPYLEGGSNNFFTGLRLSVVPMKRWDRSDCR